MGEMEDINKHLGRWGRYQSYVVALLFIPSFLGGCHTLISSFTLASPNNRCFIAGLDDQQNESYEKVFDANLTGLLFAPPSIEAGKNSYCTYCPYDNATFINTSSECEAKLSRAKPCDHGRIYDKSQYTTTLSMEFEMVCEHAWQRELLRSLFMVGVLIGAAVFGYVSDKIGRRATFVMCSLSEVVIFNIVPLVANYYLFCVLQFVGAAAQYGTYLTGFIIAMEVIDGFPRTIIGVGIQAYFTIGYLYVGLAAYLIRNWHWLQFSVSILTILYLPYFWLLPESIRWLLVNNKRELAQKTLDRACKMNRVEKLDLARLEERDGEKAKSDAKKASLLDLFRDKQLAIYTVIIFFTWFACSMTYYGLSLNTADLPGDDYVNFILSGIFELPGLALCIPAMEKFGRRPTIVVLLTGSGIASIASGLIPHELTGAVVTCATLGKMCIAAAFAVIYNYSAEIFPTVIRNTGTGFSSLFARVGAICAPQIHLLAYYVDHRVPRVIYGVFALVAAIADIFLPETNGRPMPETIADTLHLTKTKPSQCKKEDVQSNPVEHNEHPTT